MVGFLAMTIASLLSYATQAMLPLHGMANSAVGLAVWGVGFYFARRFLVDLGA